MEELFTIKKTLDRVLLFYLNKKPYGHKKVVKRDISIDLMLRELPYMKETVNQIKNHVSQNFHNEFSKTLTIRNYQLELTPIQPNQSISAIATKKFGTKTAKTRNRRTENRLTLNISMRKRFTLLRKKCRESNFS
jgi:hypothetical protein